jgi:uncharacterized 2Fe-2S/4Fe-4S cluster protein (DUF4445 family)
MGAKQMLLSRQKRSQAARIARRVNYIELTACKEFTPKFMEELYFPGEDDRSVEQYKSSGEPSGESRG